MNPATPASDVACPLLVGQPAAVRLLGCGRTRFFWLRRTDPHFPPAVRLGGRVFFRRADLIRYAGQLGGGEPREQGET
jgi:predicted DNA-binding transcriptional regulator AlpA